MSKPVMKAAAFEFQQEADCCSDVDPQILNLEIQNGADFDEGNDFYVIQTDRWAFDNIDELVEMLKRAGCRLTTPVGFAGMDKPEMKVADEDPHQAP